MSLPLDRPLLLESLRPTVSALPASLIRQIANGAMGRPGIDAFWFGESDRATPSFIVEAGLAALRDGGTFYTPNLGIPPLRAAIAAYLDRLHGRPFSIDRIAATSSGVSALMIVQQLLIEPGDRVVAVTPLWPNIPDMATALGGRVERVPLSVTNGRWTLDLQRLLDAIDGSTRLVLINSPNNPTGWTMTADERDAILAHCRRLGVWILSDDVYQRLFFGGGTHAPSFFDVAEPRDRLFGVNSFSKAWCMTGWRLGWIVAPEGLAGELEKVIEFNTSCAPEFVQRAGIAALEQGEEHVVALARDLAQAGTTLGDALRAIGGVEVPRADGAMYAFLRLARHRDSVALARDLLDRVGLGLAPGLAFGPEGEGWLRWCFAARPERLESGLARFRRYLADGVGPA
jgi:aspartate/methionine/tyrosine aminotransferase